MAEPDKVIYYPITGDKDDETTGRLFIYGDKNASNVVLLCAGFPDDQGAFSAFAAKLAQDSDCLCGVACLVGYDDYPKRPYTSNRPEGYSFNEMTTSLQAAAKALKVLYSTNPNAQFITIFHDWGSAIGAIYTNRVLDGGDALVSPDKIVYFDVLPIKLHPKSKDTIEPAKKTFHQLIMELSYRIVLASAFLIQRFISKYLAAFFFLFWFMVLRILGIAPSSPLDDKVMQEGEQKSIFRIIYMAYPYYYMFRDMFGLDAADAIGEFYLPLETPVLYLYGEAKKLQFHDENVVNYLKEEGTKKDSKSNAIGVPDAAHWLYLQQPDVCLKAVKDFIVA